MNEIMKTNGVQIFENEQFGKIRTMEIDGEPWFVGKDVALALGYSDTNKAIAMHVCEDDKLNDKMALSLGQRGGWIINESGLYSLIFSSKLSTAKEFKHWVTSEVLPSIRKHGAYMTTETLQAAILNPDYLLQIVTALKEETDKRKTLEAVVEEQKPKVAFADQVSDTKNLISMNKMAKLLHDKNIEIGRNRLLEFLREEKILMADNAPYQQYIDKGYFEVRESVKDMGRYQKTLQTTLVTGKGQQFVCKKVMQSYGDEVRE